jgi:hypothetical protein
MKYFVYYSLSGNGDALAEFMKENGYIIIKLETKENIGKINFFKMFKLGGRALFHKEMELKPFKLDLRDDDELVIGSPIWNDRLACPMNTFLNQLKVDEYRVKIILYSGGGKAKHAFTYLNKELGYPRILILKEPKKYLEEEKDILLKGIIVNN